MLANRTSYTVARNGTYFFRIAVPVHLRPIMGKRELKLPLKTRDPSAPLLSEESAPATDTLVLTRVSKRGDPAPAHPVGLLLSELRSEYVEKKA
jgi:hypothetical protein